MVLFVLLPIVVAAILVPVMVRLLSRGPTPMLTSEILAHGDPAEGTVVSAKSLGNLFDVRPMIRIDLQVTTGPTDEPFPLQVVQSFPRSMVGVFRSGDVVKVRLSPDRTAGAIEWGYEAPDDGPRL